MSQMGKYPWILTVTGCNKHKFQQLAWKGMYPQVMCLTSEYVAKLEGQDGPLPPLFVAQESTLQAWLDSVQGEAPVVLLPPAPHTHSERMRC